MESKIDTNNGEYVKPLTFVILVIASLVLVFYVLKPGMPQVVMETCFIIGVNHHLEDDGVSITAGTETGIVFRHFNTNYLFKLGHAYFITSEGSNLISVVEVKLD